jgi:hypothetical protein
MNLSNDTTRIPHGRERCAVTRFRPMLLAAAFIAWRGIVPSPAEEGPKDCLGVDFDVKRPLVASKVTSKRANFVKSARDNVLCPAEDAACEGKAHLVRGDVALRGKTLGPYTCVSYLSPREHISTDGWMVSSALSPIAPNPSSKLPDWIGFWRSNTGNHMIISPGKRGSLAIRAEEPLLSKWNPQPFIQGVEATPAGGILAFAIAAGGGSIPFDKAAETCKADDACCLVQMQLIGALLLVEDNVGAQASMERLRVYIAECVDGKPAHSPRSAGHAGNRGTPKKCGWPPNTGAYAISAVRGQRHAAISPGLKRVRRVHSHERTRK